jgi:hypothetical protein
MSSYTLLPQRPLVTGDLGNPSLPLAPHAFCVGGDAITDMTSNGRLVFSSSGNTTDASEELSSPNGLPDVYLVGGVDADGKSWRPGHMEESDEFYRYGNVMRPYETGERFSYESAASNSYDGTAHFGGTSGATPLTAGWAARLIGEARALLDAPGGERGVLARALAGAVLPARGPLSDGVFTRDELIALMHHTAIPAEQPSAARYFIEGFGAFTPVSFARATEILRGSAEEPARPDEDAADAEVRQLRRTAWAARCM